MKNNPAGVLLEKMMAVKASDHHLPMTTIWASVFKCDVADTREIVGGLVMLMELIKDAKAAVRAYAPGDPKLFLAPIDRVEMFLTTHHLASQLGSYVGFLDASTMTALEITDHILQLNFLDEHPGATKDVRDFIVTLDNILEECLASDLSQELKDLFVMNLEALRQALLRFRVGGEAVLQSALDGVTGSIVRNKDSIKNEYEIAEEFVSKTAGFMGKIEDLMNRGQNIVALASPVMNVLLPFFR
ncbi:hypothetical protein [Pseudomonas lutea]|uniref:hypothetical protein n=1 Tax=Pseudomonas lutea TaxID=243924 RepID=UPI00126A29CF|nr:hypothetical protein [Pseudomonas lutea]